MVPPPQPSQLLSPHPTLRHLPDVVSPLCIAPWPSVLPAAFSPLTSAPFTALAQHSRPCDGPVCPLALHNSVALRCLGLAAHHPGSALCHHTSMPLFMLPFLRECPSVLSVCPKHTLTVPQPSGLHVFATPRCTGNPTSEACWGLDRLVST